MEFSNNSLPPPPPRLLGASHGLVFQVILDKALCSNNSQGIREIFLYENNYS